MRNHRHQQCLHRWLHILQCSKEGISCSILRLQQWLSSLGYLLRKCHCSSTIHISCKTSSSSYINNISKPSKGKWAFDQLGQTMGFIHHFMLKPIWVVEGPLQLRVIYVGEASKTLLKQGQQLQMPRGTRQLGMPVVMGLTRQNDCFSGDCSQSSVAADSRSLLDLNGVNLSGGETFYLFVGLIFISRLLHCVGKMSFATMLSIRRYKEACTVILFAVGQLSLGK